MSLFMSKKDREREAQKKRRKAFRDAENAIDTVKERAGKLKKERDKAWAEARQYLSDGQKAAAQRCLQTVRASEILVAKLDMKRWVFEQLLSKLELAKSDQDFTQALSAINTVVQIDPEAVADVLDEVEDKLGDQVDTDKIWERTYGKEMEGVSEKMTDVVPTLDQMMKDLEDEVSEESGTFGPSKTRTSAEKAAEDAGDTASLRQRARKIIEGSES